MIRYCRLSLAACLLAILIVMWLPGLLLAADQPNVSLEEAIQKVKENFGIPAAYKEFSSGYESNNGQNAWVLTWQATGSPYGELRAQVDAGSGTITQLSNWGQESRGSATMPFNRAQARDIAEKLIKRMLPDRVSELQWVPDDELIKPMNSGGSSVYSLRWQRVSQGIPFPENGATVQVRSSDGCIVDYSLNWNKNELPSASGVISLDQARQSFSGSNILELQYIQPYPMRPGLDSPKNSILVYRIGGHGAAAIDAFTGQPINYWIGDEMYFDAGGMGGREGGAESSSLSPEEQQEINKTAQAISKEQAIQAVAKWFPIPGNLKLVESNLSVQRRGSQTHTWYLAWQDQGNSGNMINAQVNARSGEVVHYYRYYERRAGSLSSDQARSIAEEFIKKIQPNRFTETVYDKPQVEQRDRSGEQLYFNYYRMVKGIPFVDNNIGVSVNAQDGSIVSYDFNWSDASFPSSSGVLDKSRVSDVFLRERPLTLCYAVKQNIGKPGFYSQGDVGLVYKPLYSPYSSRTDKLEAFTGQPLDWQGHPIVVKRSFSFNDIEGQEAAADINAVGQAGLFGEYGSSFHPDEGLTMQSLLSNLLKARDPYNDLKTDQIINEARSRGWIKEQVKLDQTVDKVTLARIMIRYVGLEKAALAKGIYTLPYPDAQELSPGILGYAALAHGLDIAKGGSSSYDAGHTVTRAEAAAAFVRASKLLDY